MEQSKLEVMTARVPAHLVKQAREMSVKKGLRIQFIYAEALREYLIKHGNGKAK